MGTAGIWTLTKAHEFTAPREFDKDTQQQRLRCDLCSGCVNFRGPAPFQQYRWHPISPPKYSKLLFSSSSSNISSLSFGFAYSHSSCHFFSPYSPRRSSVEHFQNVKKRRENERQEGERIRWRPRGGLTRCRVPIRGCWELFGSFLAFFFSVDVRTFHHGGYFPTIFHSQA